MASRQQPAITCTTDLQTSEAKWIALKQIAYTDECGTARTWEMATRKTRGSSGIDAVSVGNVLLHPDGSRPPSTLLVVQYRPPLDAYTVEWPAGLVDADETPEQAAVREFREETGFADCVVVESSPAQAADPGMSNANMVLCMVEVRLADGDFGVDGELQLPAQSLDEGEQIQRLVVPLADLYDRLVAYSNKERFVVAAKLFHFAAGMRFAKMGKYM